LALRGWQTHNFDYVPQQIVKASHLALLCNVSHLAHFDVVDVGKDIAKLLQNYSADLVNISRYLNRSIFPSVKKLVKPGGFVVFHTFMEGCKKPKKRTI